MLISWRFIVTSSWHDPIHAIIVSIHDGIVIMMDISLLECKSGCVRLAHQARHVVPCVWISEAGQGDFIVITVQQDTFWQLHPEVCDGVLGCSTWLALLGNMKTMKLSGTLAGVTVLGCYEDKGPPRARPRRCGCQGMTESLLIQTTSLSQELKLSE